MSGSARAGWRLAAALLLLSALGCAAPGREHEQGAAPRSALAWSSPAEVLEQGPALLLQVWELDDPGDLAQPAAPLPPRLRAFRDEVARRLDGRTEAAALLAEQAQVDWLPPGDRHNTALAARGEAGRIRAIDRLEATLLEVQLGRGDMLSRPSEFIALVLRRERRLRIYYYTVDQPGLRGLGALHERIAPDLARGFALERNVHNHNFLFGGSGLLGGPVPSTADVQLFRSERAEHGLSAAAITNGFQSIELAPADFERFRGPGE